MVVEVPGEGKVMALAAEIPGKRKNKRSVCL